MKRLSLICTLAIWAFFSMECTQDKKENTCCDPLAAPSEINIPTIDISDWTDHQIVIEPGTPEIRQGHPNSILLPDGKTMYVIWTIGHGGPCGQLKRSDDGGLTWTDKLDVPDNWNQFANCPPLYLLKDPQGKERLVTYANRTPKGLKMAYAYSEDSGKTWTPFDYAKCSADTLLADIMPFTSVIPIENGKRLLGVTNNRRPYQMGRSNLLVQSYSDDGGFSWTPWRIILDLDTEYAPCEPEIIRSPDGKELLMLIRENNHAYNSWIMISRNEGKTWSEPFAAPASLTMDRHKACYTPDGRLIVVGRDVAKNSPCKGHFVAWVGTYDDIVKRREGQYRIKMLHSFKTTEYPGLSVLPDGTIVAITSLPYREGENYSIVESRFTLSEIDAIAKNESRWLKCAEN